MKLSISNIGWSANLDEEMYIYLKEQGFEGLEIAPTRIFPENPYDKLKEAESFSNELKEKYGLNISSMQSIWFGKSESIFGSYEERKSLIEYTKKAVDFAAIIGCNNIVFGCPKNRNIKDDSQYQEAVEFFREIGEYAAEKGTVIAIEPNPPIYSTNFINTTEQAIVLAKEVNCAGLKVNVDFGTIIENSESINIVAENIALVNHVHISEPFLVQIQKREMHNNLKKVLEATSYQRFVSIEMKNLENLELVKQTIKYVKEVF
jgi:sugar phosphate isomerase/epimerase